MKVIIKLAVSAIRAHRVRSAVICTAVILTTVLFMTVFSITFDIFNSTQLSLMMAGGSDLHSSVSHREINLSAEEMLEKIESQPSVKEAYILADSKWSLSVHDITSYVRVCSVNSSRILPHLFIRITEGEFPRTEQEIALNTLDFPNASVGDTVAAEMGGFMVYRPDGSYQFSENGFIVTESRQKTYMVTALYESEADRGAQVAGVVLYNSENIPESEFCSVILCYQNTLNLIGKHNELVETLASYTTSTGEVHATINNAYLSASETEVSFVDIILILLAVFVIFFCAFFLIYNIYSISLAQDMHSYSLLNTVGATYKQLRSIILRQTLILYGVSAPVGLGCGYLLGWKLIAPIFMSMSGENLNYRFNWWILILSAVLTLLTLLYSAMRPIRRIRDNSPMENVNGSAAQVYKTVWKAKRITPFVLAMRSHSRNPRRTAITALSISLSVLVLILVSSLVGLVEFISQDELTVHDILLTTYQERQIVMAESGQQKSIHSKLPLGNEHTLISTELLHEIETIAGENNVFPVYYVKDSFRAKESVRKEAGHIYSQLSEHWREHISTERLKNIADGTMEAIILSVPDDSLGYLRLSEKEYYSGDELADGTHVISLTNTNHYSIQTESGYQSVFLETIFDTGDTVRFTESGGKYTVIEHSFDESYKVLSKILGYVPWESGVQVFVMPHSVFLGQFENAELFALLVNAAEDTDKNSLKLTEEEKSFRKQIDAVCVKYRSENDGIYYVNTDGRFDGLEEMQQRMFAIQITGYSLCMIIFIIGVMNTINSALSSVIERRQECAMLEAVGMTDRQMMKMMLLENFWTGGLAGSVTALIGLPVITGILRAALEEPLPVSYFSGILMLVICIAVSILSGLAVFRLTKSSAVVERIKVE